MNRDDFDKGVNSYGNKKDNKEKWRKKTGVTKGSKYVCGECGMVVTVDEVCGCVDVCDLICCGKQMETK